MDVIITILQHFILWAFILSFYFLVLSIPFAIVGGVWAIVTRNINYFNDINRYRSARGNSQVYAQTVLLENSIDRVE